MVAHDDGSACAAWNAPVMMYDPSLEVCLLRWPKDYIDRSLAGDLCNRLSPTTGKRATPEDALAERCHTRRPDGSFSFRGSPVFFLPSP